MPFLSFLSIYSIKCIVYYILAPFLLLTCLPVSPTRSYFSIYIPFEDGFLGPAALSPLHFSLAKPFFRPRTSQAAGRTLVLRNIQVEDRGVYVCTVRREWGEAVSYTGTMGVFIWCF